MSKIIAVAFFGIGVMEFLNAINGQVDPAGFLGASQGLLAREAIAGGQEAMASYARVYGWALWGLGSVRIVYAADTQNFAAWLMCVIMHVIESLFWWSEALTAGGLAAVLSAQGAGAPTSESGVVQILTALVDAIKNGRTGENIIHHVLLFGVPGLTLLLLANKPSAEGKAKSKRS
ncbi:hypothetical protein TL16_g09953 [Triparma laevis f. inornata]|uniref:Uncharacterized protein n=2 Tax=Triparma laevis TaxID=1534972 RepID=A0A9W7CEW7_9STRA|nr:hypothetical protein TL16_g09953 [Triparma laevis f. inornata]GMI07428.1 hypothetical protein TrLO_g7591 [Triparma laevis f. longispina]